MRTAQELAATVQTHVPMKPVWHQILLSVATGDHHGYAIRESVEARTQGSMRLWPATLYGALQRMSEAGLLEEHPATDDPRGKRIFRITPEGSAVLAAETKRLEALVALGRAAVAAGDSQ